MNRNDSLTRTAKVALVLVSLWSVGGSDSSMQTQAPSRPVRQIDHIMIRTGDPREPYAFFTETLQLPIAWPMTSPRAGVMTGGVGFGNVNVEAIRVPTYVNVDERRARLRAQLVNSGGGPLGVVEVKEVVIGAVDVEIARRLWQRLLDPTPPATSNTWQIGSGPAVRLVPANENGVQTLLIRVASLERAKAFLRENQLLGGAAAGQVAIDPSKVGGLDLRLVDR
jgi:hypothetical protein